ncbi:MAG: alpha-1,2-fucosyltransferase [Oligoflexia bacterium]|nr:alpha-1,2-fucosyltransferase [Oligoflexia bacterium]
MIVTNLTVGLGNQLFQYAAGLALARARGTTLATDALSAAGCSERHNEIERFFAISARTCPVAELRERSVFFKFPAAVQRRLRWKPHLLSTVFGRYFVPESGFAFDPAPLASAADEAYLLGYWQAPAYFASVEAELRGELTFKRPLSSEGLQLRDRLTETTSVSVHIRRGDYMSAAALKLHGMCGLDYYERAVRKLQELYAGIECFVFSDDIAWAKENLRVSAPLTFISHTTGATADEDLHLMSLCRHHIVANSTFSWWGAWLNPSPKKTVLAPARWFQDEDMNQQAQSLYPDGWLKI